MVGGKECMDVGLCVQVCDSLRQLCSEDGDPAGVKCLDACDLSARMCRALASRPSLRRARFEVTGDARQ